LASTARAGICVEPPDRTGRQRVSFRATRRPPPSLARLLERPLLTGGGWVCTAMMAPNITKLSGVTRMVAGHLHSDHASTDPLGRPPSIQRGAHFASLPYALRPACNQNPGSNWSWLTDSRQKLMARQLRWMLGTEIAAKDDPMALLLQKPLFPFTRTRLPGVRSDRLVSNRNRNMTLFCSEKECGPYATVVSGPRARLSWAVSESDQFRALARD
jgi:hypothetical protein